MVMIVWTTAGIGYGRVGVRPGIFAHLDVADRIGEEDEEAAVVCIVGMKGEAKHATLAAGRELRSWECRGRSTERPWPY